jgi:hypothetical protein
MKAKIIQLLFSAGFILISVASLAQCEIKNRIYPDGSMLFYMEPVNFYWTESKALKGGVVTDKESYYLALQPSPFPEKDQGHKLKADLEMKLGNDSIYHLEHFDTRYMEHDTVMQLLYLIDKKHIEAFLNFEAISVKINMGAEEGDRTYIFKLHKAALQEQLSCFLKEEETKVKK